MKTEMYNLSNSIKSPAPAVLSLGPMPLSCKAMSVPPLPPLWATSNIAVGPVVPMPWLSVFYVFNPHTFCISSCK